MTRQRKDEETELDVKIGQRLERRRRALGLTQEKLGALVGVRFQQVQKYECATNRLTASRLQLFADALKVPVTYFYTGVLLEDCAADPFLADDRGLLNLNKFYQGLSTHERSAFLKLADFFIKGQTSCRNSSPTTHP